MRRKDCEITDAGKIREIIEKCDVLRLGLVDEAGLAYIVPVNFGVEVVNETYIFYFHSAAAGKKVDLLRRTPHISFEMDTAHALQASEKIHDHTFHYESVMGNGIVSFVEESTEKRRVLNVLMKHYTDSDAWELPDSLVNATHALRLEVTEYSAKKH